MSKKLNPEALAERSDEGGALEENIRDGVQLVTDEMILNYVLAQNDLPEESARPFAEWIYSNWYEYVDPEKDVTNADVIESALTYWCGGRTKSS